MIICITNRFLCKGDFLERIEEIAKAGPHSIILREKDLPHGEYQALAARCKGITDKYSIPLIIHSDVEAAVNLNVPRIHLPLPYLFKYRDETAQFSVIGVSVHSAWEAVQAEKLGATYLTAGHIFATDCKKGVEPRGLLFLEEVCRSVSIPVFGIGGIAASNIEKVLSTGAAGGCVMSGLMTCGSAYDTLKEFKNL